MFLQSFCVFMLCIVSAALGQLFRYDYKYVESVDGWVKLHRVPVTWHDARHKCQLEGGVLVSPSDDYLISAIVDEMQQTNVTSLFTGIHSLFSSDTYFTLQGVPLAKLPVSWAQGEPDNKENLERCLAIDARGALSDERCDRVLPYLCYKKKEDEVAVNDCGSLDLGYKLDARTQKCYKFHATGQTWYQAFMTCAAEGGHLAVINSVLESLVLKDLFAKYPTTAIFAEFKNDASIGFLDWGVRGNWRTIFDETLEQAGYSTWGANQPNAALSLGCGGIGRSAQLNDEWCNKTIPFICEMDFGGIYV